MLQENLIDIETRAFAGKLDIINEELVNKANYFKKVLNSDQTKNLSVSKTASNIGNPFLNFFGYNNVSFKGTDNNTRPDTNNKKGVEKFKNSPAALALLTGGTLLLGILMGRKMFKNFVAADNEVRKYVNKETELIEQNMKALVNKIKAAYGDNAAEADFNRLKELLQIKRANSVEAENILKQTGKLSDNDIAKTVNEIMVGIKAIYGDAPETLGGKVGQIQYYCYLDEARGHIYNWIMNPENPFAGYLFLTLTTVNAAGYSIKKAIEGIKEAAVISENKNTEKELQERLVDTEIRNFKAKKQSAIAPMMQEFDTKLNSGTSKEELKVMADNILLEIKNGPPFVYS